MMSTVCLDRVADRGAADHANRRRCSLAAAASELVANKSTDDGAEYGASASRALLDVHASYVANRAAGLAATGVALIGGRRVGLIAARRVGLIGTTRIVVGRLVVHDGLARRRWHAGGQTDRSGEQQRKESFVAQHDLNPL
jgi:hypothetical protein